MIERKAFFFANSGKNRKKYVFSREKKKKREAIWQK